MRCSVAPVIPNAIVIAGGRGGVGRTSIAANLAGVAAYSGWRVLAVDLDPHADLALDLGYHDRHDNDHGASLNTAVTSGLGQAVPIDSVRPRLDVICAGEHTRSLSAHLNADAEHAVLLELGRRLERLAGSYDLVVIDTPPSLPDRLAEAAFAAAHFLVIPTPGDASGAADLARATDLLRQVRDTANPALRLLGVVLFRLNASSPAHLVDARRLVTDAIGGPAPIYDTVVRDAAKAAEDCRALGLLAHEYEAAAGFVPGRAGLRMDGLEISGVTSFSPAASGLAADYYRLSREVLGDFREQLDTGERAADITA